MLNLTRRELLIRAMLIFSIGSSPALLQAQTSGAGICVTAQNRLSPVFQGQLPNQAFLKADFQGQAPEGSQATPPAPGSEGPTLQDLGISPAQTQGNAEEQARLDKRSNMLKIHQRLGLITAVPFTAAIISSAGAGGHTTSSSSRDLHAALGGLTGGLYFSTAYFAIRAPRIEGTPTRGPIRIHKALAWVHGPGMVLTPILGAMAFDQKSKGERVHGIAVAHGPVAIVTGGAFGAALLAVSVKF